MPPRKRAAAKAASPPPPPATALPLAGTKITICGSQRGHKQVDLKTMIEDLGGEALISIFPKDHTHLLTSPAEYKSNSNLIVMARNAGVPMVSLKWLLESKAQNAKLPEDSYLYEQPKRDTTKHVPMSSSALPPVPPSPIVAPDAPAAAPAPVPIQTRGGRKRTSTAIAAPAAAPPQADTKRLKTAAASGKKADKPKKIVVPVDDFCHVSNAVVHIGDDGTVYDASLNQTNAGNNNNKFYRIQVLRQSNGNFVTWTRWGRVGERGQSAQIVGPGLVRAISQFEDKFKSKSGLKWEDRSDNPKPNKYAYVERNYDDDDDDQDDNSADAKTAGAESKANEEDEVKPAECTLLPPVQKLMELIFNKKLFAATMTSLNYDANKLPLGKLSKTTISRGFQTLKDLSALFDDPSTAVATHGYAYDAAVERLSNLFYSVIPHAFGRNRPPILQTFAMLKKEIELLESLSDMKDAELLMKADRGKSTEDVSVHPADKHYRGLNMEEMTPLDRASTEFAELASYLTDTRGSTHYLNYKIEDIFRIQRHGEKDRFDSCPLDSKAGADTRLLWHGSRVTNYGGILGQGLRIAPPEAPVTGYMFGKGIYLADMSSKSAGYCNANVSNGTGLLLLCEAKLGSPMQKLTNAEYNAGDMAKDKGMYTTLGQGQTGPLKWKDAGVVNKDLAGVQIPDVSTPPGQTDVAGACLLYNEYIVYDVSQVRLRYLFRVKIQ